MEDGELVCFGIAEHTLEEAMPTWTPQAERQLAIMRSWFPKRKMEEITRPVYRSDFNWTSYAQRATVRVGLGLLVIRELPIKSFYSRCVIAYFYVSWFVIRSLGKGFRNNRPICLYNNALNAKTLANYPELFYWNVSRVLPKNPPVPEAHREWATRQKPVFHQAHKNVYRYRFRKARFVQWDGSMSMPVMPYMNDNGTDVINGTFKRQCNSVPTLK